MRRHILNLFFLPAVLFLTACNGHQVTLGNSDNNDAMNGSRADDDFGKMSTTAFSGRPKPAMSFVKRIGGFLKKRNSSDNSEFDKFLREESKKTPEQRIDQVIDNLRRSSMEGSRKSRKRLWWKTLTKRFIQSFSFRRKAYSFQSESDVNTAEILRMTEEELLQRLPNPRLQQEENQPVVTEQEDEMQQQRIPRPDVVVQGRGAVIQHQQPRRNVMNLLTPKPLLSERES